MSSFNSEWLVSDQRGAFAMGTRTGVRTRKYHGFFMGIAGRSETAFLADLDLTWNGIPLWPHLYSSPEGPILHPDLEDAGMEWDFELTDLGPQWQWHLPGGKLKFSVAASFPGGISLAWKWLSRTQNPCLLQVRGFWAMRDLHGLGGKTWTWQPSQTERNNTAWVVSDQKREAHCLLRGNWTWKDDPQWNRNFHYSEEVDRGYSADEDLYSAGVLEIELAPGMEGEWVIAEDPNDLEASTLVPRKPRPKLLDFVLTRPAGIAAGFPWFGEWGRDTFVSLPGITARLLKSGEDPNQTWLWVQELLHRWGAWIDRSGMLPNVIEKEGYAQMEAADATLWWCHSLASLWSLSLCPPYPFPEIQREFSGLLARAIESIRSGRHLFLRETSENLLEVTEGHTTWMDARVNGQAVTPRLGLLPEINALWFQARCLQWLWSENDHSAELEALGVRVLQCREPERPNTIFLHSLPLAPSFILKDWDLLERDLIEIAEKFWTPVGLRTLRPTHPSFRPRCVGTQQQRDQTYHQGPAWAWLGGNFEIGRHRLISFVEDTERFDHSSFDKMFPSGALKDMPIEGHISEIFDAEPPYTPRGTPAQAWSEACLEEARARRRLKVDSKLSKVLAQRWLGRGHRREKELENR